MDSQGIFDLWFCLNCSALMNLDCHGRCPVCGSNAVDIAVRPEVTVEALQALYSPKIRQELHGLAEDYVTIRDRRIALNREEKPLKDNLLAAMHRFRKTHYHHNGLEITVVHESEKVKVKLRKDDEGRKRRRRRLKCAALNDP